jgi:glycosyltransferase involved in cell wall biosynthesis
VAPLVSVIIPAHNSGVHLKPTLESVLAQEHRPLEVVVVDDGSTDGTADVAESFGPPVVVVRQACGGHPAARNAGIRASSGEFLAFVDHDDLWSPGRLSAQLACFDEDPSLDLVFGHIRNFFSEELTPEERAVLRTPMEPLPGLLQGAMVARRASFLRVGFFDEARLTGDFLYWYGRAMVAELRTRMLPEVVLHRRIHRLNHQRVNRHLVGPGYLRAVKDLLDRRRAAAKHEG